MTSTYSFSSITRTSGHVRGVGKSPNGLRTRALCRAICIFVVAGSLQSASSQVSVSVPNFSFESQVAAPPYYVDTRIDSWQKPDKPAYFDETAFGILWDQTAGAFLDTNPYSNIDGNQGAYLLSFSQVGLFQDYNTVDWNDGAPSHEFDALFLPGNVYTLTVGVFGKSMTDGSTLELSLYYRDGSDSMMTVASTTVTYLAANFPQTPPLSLFDFSVSTAAVQAADAWAGQHIGIKLESTFGTGAGYWDVDNVRLTAIPEPATLSMVGLGVGGLFLLRHHPPGLRGHRKAS